MATFKDAAEYVNNVGNSSIEIPNDLSVTPDGVIVEGTTSFTVRELICSLLAGNGIKLPNLQICLKVNLARAIQEISGLDPFQGLSELQSALNDAEAALDSFIAHTDIENVLGRLNGAVAEFAAIANMINFCGTPVSPRPIPNVLDDMFGAFTGAGQDILDGLGKMADSDIGGCISTDGGFNTGLFVGGSLKDLGDVFEDLRNGVTANFESRISSITNQLNGFAKDMQELVEFENNYAKHTVENNQTGGSVFTPPSRINTGVGMGIDHNSMDLTTAQRHASALRSAYSALKAYRLSDGRSVFDLILEPELIARLDGQDSVNPLLGERVPILDYCGRPTGEYIENVEQAPVPSSTGSAREESAAPGNVGRSQAKITRIAPTNRVGRPGDVAGDIAYDAEYVYTAIADYDGTTSIWVRAPLDTNW